MPKVGQGTHTWSCRHKIKSFFSLLLSPDGWTTEDLQYLWKTKEPVQIVPNLHLPRFTLEKYISDYCNIETNTGDDADLIGALLYNSIKISFYYE